MEKNSQNYQMDLENYQNLTSHNPSCLLAIKKFMKWNPNSNITLTHNLKEYFSLLWNFFGDTSFRKRYTCQLLQNLLNFFYRLPVCYHDIITNFMDFRLLLIFVELKIYLSTSHSVPFRDEDVRIFHSIDWQCLKFD